MFEVFQKSYSVDPELSTMKKESTPRSESICVNRLAAEFGGVSFNRGLYRVISASDIAVWNDRIALPFPNFSGRIHCFGFDWLGRVFAIDPKRPEHGEPGVVMFEPGTGEALEIPCNIATFHEEELIEYSDAALASNFHERWLINGGSAPGYGQCVAYKKPLFLGGADELYNLEISNIDVYWHLMGQLIDRTRGLPPGTPVRGIGWPPVV